MGWVETDTSDNDRWEYLNDLGIRVRLSWLDENQGDVMTGYRYRIGEDTYFGVLPGSISVDEAKAEVIRVLRQRMEIMIRFLP